MKTFEERLNRLEEINELMRANQVPLEEALKLFEEGMKLSKGLEKELAKIERKIEIMINKPDTPEEKPEMDLFTDLETD